jgi:hypothetical protein
LFLNSSFGLSKLKKVFKPAGISIDFMAALSGKIYSPPEPSYK